MQLAWYFPTYINLACGKIQIVTVSTLKLSAQKASALPLDKQVPQIAFLYGTINKLQYSYM